LRRRASGLVDGGVFSADGKLLAVACREEGSLGSIWDVGRWEPKVELKRPSGHAGGSPLAFSPDGKRLAGRSTITKDAAWGGDNILLWDTATGRARVLHPEGATLVLPGAGTFPRFVGPDGNDKVPGRQPLVSSSPIAVSFPADAGSGRMFVEYQAGYSLFTTLWDTAGGKPLRSETYGRGEIRLGYGAQAGSGSPAPGSTADLYRFRTTPSGRILLLPRYRTPPIIAVPHEDGTIALAVRPTERDFNLVLPYPDRTFTELARLKDYKGSRPDCRLTPDGRRLVVVGTDPAPQSARPVAVLRVWDVSGLHADAAGKMKKLPAGERERLWAVLFEDHSDPEIPNQLKFSPAQYHQAMQAMASLVWHGDDGVAWLRKKMGRPFNLKDVPRLLADLDSPYFKTRAQATRELERLGQVARSALVKALAKRPALETKKRIEALLAKLEGTAAAYELRQMRIIDVLEHINTPAARELLDQLAEGRYDPTFADEARQALRRATGKK
jgi:hypothetical protein